MPVFGSNVNKCFSKTNGFPEIALFVSNAGERNCHLFVMTNYAVISPFTCVGHFAIYHKNEDPYSRFRGLLFCNLVRNPWPIVESCQTVFAQQHQPFMRREFHVFYLLFDCHHYFATRANSFPFPNLSLYARVATKKNSERLSYLSGRFVYITVFHLFVFWCIWMLNNISDKV